MNKDKGINIKILKRFLNLIDKDMDMRKCVSELADNQDILRKYAQIIEDFKNLKNIRANNDFEEKSLKDIYLRSRIENIAEQKKDLKKDMLLFRLHPFYLKPLMIFLAVFVFLSFSFTGTIYASGNSVPGELLYPVKRASENIRITLTPYKYENIIYLKMLDSRLSEADILLNLSDFKDAAALENLVTDIDDTYKSCKNRNYLGSDQDVQMQIKISAVKEGFKKRYGIKIKNTDDFSGNNIIDDVQDTANFNEGAQDFEEDNPESNNNSEVGNKNSLNTGEQNQKGKQNQYGK